MPRCCLTHAVSREETDGASLLHSDPDSEVEEETTGPMAPAPLTGASHSTNGERSICSCSAIPIPPAARRAPRFARLASYSQICDFAPFLNATQQMLYCWREQFPGITRAAFDSLSMIMRHPSFTVSDVPINERALSRWEDRAWPQQTTIYANSNNRSAHVSLRDIIREFLSDEVSSCPCLRLNSPPHPISDTSAPSESSWCVYMCACVYVCVCVCVCAVLRSAIVCPSCIRASSAV